MSRIPQLSSSRTSTSSRTQTTPTTPSKPRVTASSSNTPASARIRTQSTPRAPPGLSTGTPKPGLPSTPAVRKSGSALSLKSKPAASNPSSPTKARPTTTARVPVEAKPPNTPSMSIREAIALKRNEAKKAQSKSGGGLASMSSLEDALPPHAIPANEEEDLLGRASLRETIEKARSTGSLNLATRSLKCLPSALFEIHLSITPDQLKSVPEEPPLPPAPAEGSSGKTSRRNAPTWFEAQDLQVLKAWSNEIQEIQHEISLFGSLKVVDFHNNQLTSIPNSLADLSVLTNLDLSHNRLTILPINLFSLPELVSLNISHNALTSLPLNAFFETKNLTRNNHNTSVGFFTPEIIRATSPLPKLLTLNASHNKITAQSIDSTFPKTLTKIDLSENPLGPSQSLLEALATLPKLREVLMERADIGDDSFPLNLLPSSPFPSLKLLDLGETRVTLPALQEALKDLKQELNHDFVKDELPEGITRAIVGKKIVKEKWEIELEKRTKHRFNKSDDFGGDWDETPRPTSISPAPSASSNVTSIRSTSSRSTKTVQEVLKEAWEVEAEAGLLTEGGRRRARAAAAQEQEKKPTEAGEGRTGGSSLLTRSPSSLSLTLSNPQYYDRPSQTLTLPPSQLPKSPGHNRALSLAVSLTSPSTTSTDVTLPVHTLPLNVIVTQSFAQTLRSLILVNRRADRSFALPLLPPAGPQGFLPCLEDLDLEGCNLPDLVPVLRTDTSSAATSPSPAMTPNSRAAEPLLLLLASLFPSLRTLNLSYNALTAAALTYESLSALILSSPGEANGSDMHKKGLRHLRLRGNRITDLDGLQTLGGLFKGNRDVTEWKLEELDLRDNEIGRLPAEVGLLPLDVLLVDGNTFRVPQRRVWEREGTKGLLSWLRGRIE